MRCRWQTVAIDGTRLAPPNFRLTNLRLPALFRRTRLRHPLTRRSVGTLRRRANRSLLLQGLDSLKLPVPTH
jgi:hypothetical protein